MFALMDFLRRRPARTVQIEGQVMSRLVARQAGLLPAPPAKKKARKAQRLARRTRRIHG